jgi:hypothetical protein
MKATESMNALAFALVLQSACSQAPTGATPPAGGAPLQDAFLAAYGKPAPYETIDDSGDHVIYTPQALKEVAPGVVALISKGVIPDGCYACGGSLSIDYLKHDAAGYHRLGSWPGIAGKGQSGKALPWTIRTDLDNGPTLVTTRDQKDPSCSATLQELVTLTPTKPIVIATLVVATTLAPDDKGRGGGQVTGTVVPIERGKRFAVVLTGSDSIRQIYIRQGEVFTTQESGATGC